MAKPIFSIIIPAYNEEKLLGNCLEAVLDQDFPQDEYEVIVVNNASQDKTPIIARQFKVKVINQPEKSLVLARQTGLQAAQGRYFVNLDADVQVPPAWLAGIHQHFKDNPQVGLVTGPYACVSSKTETDYLNQLVGRLLHLGWQLFDRAFCYYGGNVAIKRQLFLKVGGYDLNYPTDQLSILRRLEKAGAKTVFDQKLTVRCSPRRTKGRLLKFYLKEVFWLYLINNLYIKLTGKSLGSWEDIR